MSIFPVLVIQYWNVVLLASFPGEGIYNNEQKQQ